MRHAKILAPSTQTDMRGVRLLLGTIVASEAAMAAIILKESEHIATGPLLTALAWPWLAAGGLLGGTYLAWRRHPSLRTAPVRTIARRAVRPLVDGAAGLALIAVALVGAIGASAQTVTPVPGETAVVFDGRLNVRDDATINANVIEVLEDGATVTVVDGPVPADGYDWYLVDTADGTSGWVDGEFLAAGTATSTGSAPSLAAGDSAVVVDGTLNLRDDATIDAGVVTVLADGTAVTVLDGPVAADGYTWYQVEAADGAGWVAGEYLAEDTSTGDVLGDADFATGDAVFVNTDRLNLRGDAGIDADVLTVLETGAGATVVSGPASADGYTWYEVEIADSTTGWVAGEYLALA